MVPRRGADMNVHFAMAAALMVVSCKPAEKPNGVSKPLAQTDIPVMLDADRANKLVGVFASKNHFAVQPLIGRRQGAVAFSVRLFRDDISVLVTQLNGGSIQVTAYPLCACELGRRLGLRSAAENTVAELRRQLTVVQKSQ